MSELDKVLEWVSEKEKSEKHVLIDKNGIYIMIGSNEIKDFINSLKNPPKKLTWQCRTVSDPEWRNIGDGEYEDLQYLVRFEFRKVEI